jgi:hypothetical protein
MRIAEWRRTRAAHRADRLALRAEQSRGDGWLEYRRRRRASKRAMGAERRAAGRTGQDIQLARVLRRRQARPLSRRNIPPRGPRARDAMTPSGKSLEDQVREIEKLIRDARDTLDQAEWALKLLATRIREEAK